MGNDDLLHVTWQAYLDGSDEVYYTVADITDDQVPPVVSVIEPQTDDLLVGGSTVPIQWSAVDNTGIPEIAIEYTTDGGAAFTPIASAIANSGGFAWVVPDITSGSVQVRVTATDIAGNQGADTSGAFSIEPAPAPSMRISAQMPPVDWHH